MRSAQFLLFIDPDEITDRIDRKLAVNAMSPRPQLIYDGKCQFCLRSVQSLKVMDLFDRLAYVDLHAVDLKLIHPQLDHEKALSQLHLVEPDLNAEQRSSPQLFGGFFVIRRIAWMMPMLYPFIPIFYFPGMGWLGPWVYRFVAQNRYVFHSNNACQDHACFRKPQ